MNMSTAKPIITTRTCSRCGGTGQHSFNLVDGTRCYGCGGHGVVPCAPVGQAKIKPTADSLDRAHVGDIVEIACVLYQVVIIYWRKSEFAPVFSSRKDYNQTATCIRLVDGEVKHFKRCYMEFDYEALENGTSYCLDNITGIRSAMKRFVDTPSEMIGQVFVDPAPLPEYPVIHEEQSMAIVQINGKYCLRQRNEYGTLVYVPTNMKSYARQSGALKALRELIGG